MSSTTQIVRGATDQTGSSTTQNPIILLDAQGRQIVVSTGGGTGGATQVEGNAASGAADTGNPVKTAAVYRALQPTFADGQRADNQSDPRGNLQVAVMGWGQAGSLQGVTVGNPSGDTQFLGSLTHFRVANTAYYCNGSTWDRARGTAVGASVVLKPEATGGSLMTKIISAASTNATAVKASASSVVGIDVYNSGAAVCFLKLYNKASAPVVGTDTPVKVIAIPPGAPREINRPLGEAFTVGLAYAITTGFADADTGAVTAGQVTGSIDYA